MVYIHLTACIVASVLLFIILKAFHKFKIDRFQGVTFNYLTCIVVGVMVAGFDETMTYHTVDPNIIIIAPILGGLFFLGFNMIGLTAQRVNVAAASLATKLSMVVPILLNIFLWKTADEYTFWGYFGLSIAIVSVFLSSYRSNNDSQTVTTKTAAFLLFSVFIVGGLVDSMINYVNFKIKHPHTATVFPIYAFLVASILGVCVITYRHIKRDSTIQWRAIVGGMVLGTVNYFSIFWMLRALEDFNGDGAYVFSILNLSVIVLGAFGGLVLFKERLNFLNVGGLILAVVAILLINFG